MAFAMANQLRELGHEVNLLILYDVLPSTQYDGRLLLFYSANESVSPYGIFNAPELGISKMFSGDLSIYHYDWGHNDKDFLDHLGSFAADVQYEISCLKNHQVSSKTVKSPLTAPLQDKYFARKVWARVPRMVKASDSIEVPVTIQNCSAEDWQPTEQSGVTLSSRWVGTSNIVRKQRAGYVSFDAGVPAADKQVFSLRIRTPDKPGLRSLEIDLLEEGVDWLGTSSKVAFRQWVWVKAS